MPYISFAFCGPIKVKVISEDPKHEWLPGTRWSCLVVDGGPGFKVGEELHGIAGDMIYDTMNYSAGGSRITYNGRKWMNKFPIKEVAREGMGG